MTLVVADTGPILHLHEAQALHLLPFLGTVHIPQAVAAETHSRLALPEWFIITPLDSVHEAEATHWHQMGWLDVGEAEALALVRQLKARWLLTDDSAARLFAQTLQVEAHGSLGVVLWGAAQGHLSEPDAQTILQQLAASSLWLSARILAEARDALYQIYHP